MELLPKEVREQLPPLYAQENEHDPLVYVKYFHPLSSWTWYASEGEQEGDDFLFFGWVNGDFPELGYFSLQEMQSGHTQGAFHFFAPTSPGTAGVEGGRLRKGLRQE